MAQWQHSAINPYHAAGVVDAITPVNGNLFVWGSNFIERAGESPNNLFPAKPYVYNIKTDQWSKIAPEETVKTIDNYTSVCSSDTHLYILGGQYGSSSMDSGFFPVYSYDIATKIWTKEKIILPVSQAACAYVNGIIYIFGSSYSYSYGDEAKESKDVWIYNTISKTGNRIDQKCPTFRSGSSCAVIGSKIYLIGGSGSLVDGWPAITKVDIFDTTTGTWSTAPSAPVSLFTNTYKAHHLPVMGNEIFCLSDHGLYVLNIDNGWRYHGPEPESIGGAYEILDGIYYTYLNRTGYHKLSFLNLATAQIANPSPASGYVNEQAANTFTWELVTNPAGTLQASAAFQWRRKGASSATTLPVSGPEQYITVPPNTFPDGEIEWRVMATGANGAVADYTEWYLLNTVDQKPLPPVNLFPNSGMEDGTKTIQFFWLHRSPLSTPQRAFELRITYDGGATWKNISGKVAQQGSTFTAAGGTILPVDPTGAIGWQVRTYNSDDMPSDWSATATFIVIPAPQAPHIISVAAKSRPAVQWQSTGQVGWRLQVVSGDTVFYDTGQQHGEDKFHQIRTTYLHNGLYTVRVQISNLRGMWSEWGTREININTRSRLQITLTGKAIENGAQLDWETEVLA